MASAQADTTEPKDLDRGYDEYKKTFMDMRVRIFYGHVECMSDNAGKVPPTFVRALLDVKRDLELKPEAEGDSLVKHAIVPPPVSLVVPAPTMSEECKGLDPGIPEVVFGAGSYNINMSAYVLQQPRRRCLDDSNSFEPDPTWTAPPETVQFAVKAALSMRDRDSPVDMQVCRIDLDRLKDPLVRARAQRLFGSRVRYLNITDMFPVYTSVFYDVHDGTVSGFRLTARKSYNLQETQPACELLLKDLWNVHSGGHKEKEIDRSLPEFNIFKILIKERFGHIQRSKDYAARLDALQHHLEIVHRNAYETFAMRRENKTGPGQKFSGWQDLKQECKMHLSAPDAWKISLFLWRYTFYFAANPKPREPSGSDEMRVEVNGLIVKLSKWLRIHLDWLFTMPSVAFDAILAKEVKGVDAPKTGKKRARCEDDDTDSSDDERDISRSEDEQSLRVNVLFGPRNAGKSTHCGLNGAYETFSLFEYMKFVSVFPHKDVYLILSCNDTKQAHTLIDSQTFVSGTFVAELSFKESVKEKAISVGTYQCTLSRPPN
jgi:hypothetical protein